jgi:hypothetical protein
MSVVRETDIDMCKRGKPALWRSTAFIAGILISTTVSCVNMSICVSQKYMRETAAVAGIQTIHKVQEQYHSQYGRYAASLGELGPPQNGAAGPAGADLIGNDLARGKRQGYRFTVSGAADAYVIHADPVSVGISGNKSFYSDQTTIIRENYGTEPATANSKALRSGDR